MHFLHMCYKVSTTVQVITANKTKTTHRFCYLLLLQHLNRLSKWSHFQKYRQFPKSRDIHPVDGFLLTRQDCVYFPHVIFRDFIWNIDQMSRTHESFCDSFCAKSKKMLTWRMEKGNSVKKTLSEFRWQWQCLSGDPLKKEQLLAQRIQTALY